MLIAILFVSNVFASTAATSTPVPTPQEEWSGQTKPHDKGRPEGARTPIIDSPSPDLGQPDGARTPDLGPQAGGHSKE